MRWLLLFVLLAVLVALPQSVTAQADEDGARSEQSAKEPVTEPAPPSEPALQLELDDAGVRITPSPALTPDGYTLEEAERRVKDARVAVFTMLLPVVVGITLVGVSGLQFLGEPIDAATAMVIGGAVTMGVGFGGIVGFGVMLANRNTDLEALKSQQRRAQWDLARSRLVF